MQQFIGFSQKMYNFSNRSRGIAVAGFLPPRKSLSRSGRHRKTDTSTTRHLATHHLAATRHLAAARHLATRRRQPPYPHTTTDRPRRQTAPPRRQTVAQQQQPRPCQPRLQHSPPIHIAQLPPCRIYLEKIYQKSERFAKFFVVFYQKNAQKY